ncbi:VanZ family protein [Protaetiibacter mangrovi]|uniref:VanZ family protein n=1 Tax=Protaetiibacter mangrovi TaxID=2970926 RepID=A0ABT1ZBL5_9MICO|nr:VanZ family protein [Protaetiibacter mangrovi]MCS0498085.1 VanZ family protein [Protaetiibacter mangrovi]TPX03615.1 VanZ family protein [Schumannella luteola]
MRLLLRILFALYLVAVGFVVWSPQPESGSGVLAVIVRWIVSVTSLPAGPTYDTLEVAANVVMFLPFGVLAMTAYRWMRVWSTTLAGLATSALIEGVQLALPSRYSTVSDLIANTAGALLGALLVAGVRRARRRSQESPSSA